MSSSYETAAERDRRLVGAVERGDQGAFEELYECYREWVFTLALRFSGRREDALDVVQETFLYLLSKFPGLELSGRLTTFLYPAVKHLAMAARRRAGHYASDEQALDAAPAAPEVPTDLRSQLKGALVIVPEHQREVLLMRFVDDMTLEEIGVALELPVGTVKSRLHHALRFLRSEKSIRSYFEEGKNRLA